MNCHVWCVEHLLCAGGWSKHVVALSHFTSHCLTLPPSLTDELTDSERWNQTCLWLSSAAEMDEAPSCLWAFRKDGDTSRTSHWPGNYSVGLLQPLLFWEFDRRNVWWQKGFLTSGWGQPIFFILGTGWALWQFHCSWNQMQSQTALQKTKTTTTKAHSEPL